LPQFAGFWKTIQQQLARRLQAKQTQAVEAAAGSALLPVPGVTAPVPWVTHQHEGQKHDMLRDGATGTGYPPEKLTSQGCFIAEHKTPLFSDASQI